MTFQPVSNRRKVLCLFPRHTHGFATFSYAFRFFPDTRAFMPPQGILTIAAYLPKAWDVRFIDENVKPATDADFEWADVVLASGMHPQRKRLIRIAEQAHRFGKIAVLGGPSVSACPEYYPDFDILHLGELGDGTDRLIAALDASVDRRDCQEIFETKERLTLDEFPIPAYHLINASHYMMMSVQWSSGCPYSCEFCDIPALYGKNPRYKSPERLIAELEVILARDPLGAVFFVDDNLIGNKKAAKQLLPKLIEWQKRTNYRLRLIGECTLNLAQDRDLLSMMREAYFTDIFFGVESPDPDALVAMDKHQNVRMPVSDAVKIINSYGIGLHAGLIIGLDSDDDTTVAKINRFIDESNIPALGINVLYAPPKTPLWRRLEAEGRLIPIDQVVESNVVFNDPEPVVMSRWAKVIEHAFEPAALFARFSHNITHTYANRLQLPLSRFGFSWNLLRNGVFALISVIFYLGIMARYRAHFWRMLVSALRSGQLDAMIYVATCTYHFIRFRDDVLAGRAQVCIHSQAARAISQELRPVRPRNRHRPPQLRMAG